MVEEKLRLTEDGNSTCDSEILRIRCNRDVTLRHLVSTTSIRYINRPVCIGTPHLFLLMEKKGTILEEVSRNSLFG